MNSTEKQQSRKKPALTMGHRILLLAGLILLPFVLYTALPSPMDWWKAVVFSLILLSMAVIAILG